MSSSTDMHMREMTDSKTMGVFSTHGIENHTSYPSEDSYAATHTYTSTDYNNTTNKETSVPFLANPFQKDYWRQHKKKIIVFQIVILIILLILLLIFFVIIPVITRKVVARNEFALQKIFLTNIDNNNLNISVSQSIGSVPFNPRISAFTAKVYTTSNDRILDIAIPQFHGENVDVPAQRVQILNMAALGALGANLINNDVNIFLVGSTTVRVLSRDVGIHFNKTVRLAALDLQASVASVNKTNGVATAVANIQTSGQVSVDLGISTFNLVFGSSRSTIGKLVGAVKLAPGNNSLPLILTPLISVATLPQFVDSASLTAAIATGRVSVTVAGSSNNASTWANQTIQAVQRPVNVTSAQLLSAIV
ncbi:protein of unknown function [Taphrina deformans PYCC 5710]|uniref:Pre-rRNA processing protein n=1 Tax=Taphrina deformans (strain PYCC 5710 / ATCC 11124 / CBS 356.35 / IMI 108563 / JCM 9778 / NBRC 8474) TaxID=1097556 RepID=R4XH81_TAPDE|nr:protein of unknown function [Taphrina deformans PYCC 5710]|eukprot:CCG85147.1 protein of unknown function [Taphrina deformans PYCC 5710]